jgi:heterodisulfide reductase subunit A
MLDAGRHPKVNILAYSEVNGISGVAGDFKVTVLRKARYVDENICNACGACWNVCPTEVPNDFEMKLSKRRAAYIYFPQGIPAVATIDRRRTPPCQSICPADQHAQGYIALIAARKFKRAYDLIRQDNPLPGILGRVCVHNCESACTRGDFDEPIAICALKRFVTDWKRKQPKRKIERPERKYDERVAIVGSGPAGLTVADVLARALSASPGDHPRGNRGDRGAGRGDSNQHAHRSRAHDR